MENISIIGWLHTITCIAAMFTGAVALFAVKGSVDHKKWGRWYIYTMISTNISALLIYPDGVFNMFHWMAVGTLAAVLLGWYGAARQRSAIWAYTHLTCMIWSYYMLYGGLINEAFLRVAVLRTYSPFFGGNGAIFGMIQMIVMFVFIVFWIKYVVRTMRLFKQRRANAI